MEIRIGNGYDIHKLINNRDFILGGIKIPYNKGFLAHSDGDVLIHAIIDALLGASSLGDIGRLYPDNDIKYKNIDSSLLLKKTIDTVRSNNFEIINIDTVIICQKPKLKNFIPAIINSLSLLLGIGENQISVKPKTKENLDASGKNKAVEVYAVCLLNKNK